MKISEPQIIQQEQELVFRVNVEFAQGSETLWYSLNREFGDFISDSCDAPLAALLIPAMANGEDIHIEGTISEKLFYNLSGPYQSLLQHVIPSLHRIQLYPDDVHARTKSASGVATGFSGGIDSFGVLADHYYAEVPDQFKVTHLLFNNVGSHGGGKDGERIFRGRFARLQPVAEKIGLPFIMVNSNVDTFYGNGLGFQRTHTPRNTSVALLLQGGINHYMYASTYSFADAFVGATYDMAYTDTIALPMLSTELLDAFSVGSEYTRVEKTLRVAEIDDSYGTLDICINPDHTINRTNCSKCWKCLRTLLTLDIAGMIYRYSDSFDLYTYKRRRNRFIGKALVSGDPLLREIVRFAKTKHYSIPFQAYLYGPIYVVFNAVKSLQSITNKLPFLK